MKQKFLCSFRFLSRGRVQVTWIDENGKKSRKIAYINEKGELQREKPSLA